MASKVEAIDLLSSDDELQNIPSSIEEWSAPPAKRRRASPEPEKAGPVGSVRASNKIKGAAVKKSGLTISNVQWSDLVDGDDPIEFTSSVHQPSAQARPLGRQKGPSKVANDPQSDDSLPDLFHALEKSDAPPIGLSSRTAALLASLQSNNPTTTTISTKSKSRPATTVALPKKKASLTEAERLAREQEQDKIKEAKAAEREEAKQRRAKEKEDEAERKREKRQQDEAQRRDAKAHAEVNKADKVKKEVSTPEMILDLPESLLGTDYDHVLHAHGENLKFDVTSYQSPVPNVIKWRRKTKARWNDEKECWEVMPETVIDEKHILCLMPAATFIPLALAEHGSAESLDSHVAKLRSAYPYPDLKIIYMIEGLDKALSKSRNAENRAYQAQVRGEDPNTTATGKKRKQTVTILNVAKIENVVLRLQIKHRVLIHHTAIKKESIEWILAFTQHISTVPYRQQRLNLQTTFSMESGQVRTGSTVEETFTRMLEEGIIRVTPSIARGVAFQYPSVAELIKAFRDKGPLCLEDLKKSALTSGAFTDRKVGPAISRRIYKVFMERDPESTDV